MQDSRPPAFAQDPVYSKMDMDFLAALNITVKKDNTAFDLVNKKSFVYLPNAEYRVSVEVMIRDPELYLGGLRLRFTIGGPTTELKTSGFMNEIECDGLTGSRAAALIETNFDHPSQTKMMSICECFLALLWLLHPIERSRRACPCSARRNQTLSVIGICACIIVRGCTKFPGSALVSHDGSHGPCDGSTVERAGSSLSLRFETPSRSRSASKLVSRCLLV